MLNDHRKFIVILCGQYFAIHCIRFNINIRAGVRGGQPGPTLRVLVEREGLIDIMLRLKKL
jgi:hypothetical protein